ncbi:MAG: hypothetical protein IKQ46_10685 [Bacteroidales bacterium]|nr:hypothetical protein [Bacteroidales bacterium]
MATVSFRLSEREHKYAEQLAKFQGVKLSDYFRNIIHEQAEDFEDLNAIKELEKDMVAHPENYKKTYTLKEVAEELGF